MRPITLNTLVYMALAAAVLQAQGFPAAPRDLNQRGDGVNRLQAWIEAVQSHHPGIPGDATRAAKAIETVLSPASEPNLRDDPFWTYFTVSGRDADALLAHAYRALTQEAP